MNANCRPLASRHVVSFTNPAPYEPIWPERDLSQPPFPLPPKTKNFCQYFVTVLSFFDIFGLGIWIFTSGRLLSSQRELQEVWFLDPKITVFHLDFFLRRTQISLRRNQISLGWTQMFWSEKHGILMWILPIRKLGQSGKSDGVKTGLDFFRPWWKKDSFEKSMPKEPMGTSEVKNVISGHRHSYFFIRPDSCEKM